MRFKIFHSFSNTALQQSTVRLTWDETDQKRLQMTMRKFDKDELMDMDFKAYLASSSENEDGEKEAEVEENANGNDSAKDDEEDKIKKYRVRNFYDNFGSSFEALIQTG